jgi:hypothetical protein
MKKAVLPEAFLHFLWQTQRFHVKNLQTTTGQAVRIIHPGHWNTDAGPDFLNARIQIDDTLWAGQVEIHWYASEWFAHGHQHDPAYRNVILHVVFANDQPVHHANGTAIPTLELEGRILPEMVERYKQLRGQTDWLACRHHFQTVKSIYKSQWADRMGVERLEVHTDRVATLLTQYRGDWDQALFVLVARALGLRVNATSMENLATQFSLSSLHRYRGQRLSIEAFLFGLAGMLGPEYADDYPKELQRTFSHLKRKHGIRPLNGLIWKFSRMRPANFPTLRLAQLAALMDQNRRWLADLLDCIDLQDVESYLHFEVSPYWLIHYRFDQPASRPISSRFGKSTFHLLVINAFAPVLFHYGRTRNRPEFCLRAQQWLENVPPEKNAYMRQWEKFGLQPSSAFHSQALLHWRRDYCERKRCLDCQIGRQLLC